MEAEKNNSALKTHRAWKKLVLKCYWILAYAGDCLSGAKYKEGFRFGRIKRNNQKQK